MSCCPFGPAGAHPVPVRFVFDTTGENGRLHLVYCSADQIAAVTRRLLRVFGHDRFRVIAVDGAADQRQLVPPGSRRSFGE